LSASITDVGAERTLKLAKQRPDFALGKSQGKVQSATWTTRTVESPTSPLHLQVEITTSYKAISGRQPGKKKPRACSRGI